MPRQYDPEVTTVCDDRMGIPGSFRCEQCGLYACKKCLKYTLSYHRSQLLEGEPAELICAEFGFQSNSGHPAR